MYKKNMRGHTQNWLGGPVEAESHRRRHGWASAPEGARDVVGDDEEGRDPAAEHRQHHLRQGHLHPPWHHRQQPACNLLPLATAVCAAADPMGRGDKRTEESATFHGK